MHALVQIIFNALKENIPVSEDDKFKLMRYKNALVKLAEANVPFKTKKQVLAQEGGGFIQELLTLLLVVWGFLCYKDNAHPENFIICILL